MVKMTMNELSQELTAEELRYDILGRVGKILFVVCAFRDQNVIRMISARLATASEKERYEYGEDDYE